MLLSAMAPRTLGRGLALAAAFCLCCAGQESVQVISPGSVFHRPPIQVRTLSGTVVNSVTGEPIPRALVQVFLNPPIAVMTGPDGRFDLPKVPADHAVSIGAERPGYGSRNGFQRQMVGSGENNITIKLTPQGGIRGRISEEGGQPLEGIQVQAIAEQIVAGRKQERTVSATSTDQDGQYEFDGLEPGDYFVRTLLHRLYMTLAPLPAAEQAYPGEYYLDAPDRSGAQLLQVSPGETAEADFTLSPVRTFRVSGILAGGDRFGRLMLKHLDGDWEPIPLRFNRGTGRFSFLSVPAGSYKLEFRSFGRRKGGSDDIYAERRLDVNADVTGLEIVPQPLANIVVNIIRPPAASSGILNASADAVQVLLTASQSNIGYGSTTANRQGAAPSPLEIFSVPPGTYHVAVHTYGSDCLDSVTSGSADLSNGDLNVSPGVQPQPITVTLSNDCATLNVSVRTDGRPAPVEVLMVPESGGGEPKVVSVAPDANFNMMGLRPGDYRVYAFSTLNGLEYTSPDALRKFTAYEITLNANEKANAELDLIVRGDQ